MNWLDRLERRYGNIYIPQLMNIVVVGQLAAWAIVMLINQNLYYALLLTRAGLLQGQIWRLVTFVFVPPITSILRVAIQLYFYWFLGTTLERTWGSFRFNVYFLVGMLGAVLGCLITGYGSADGLFLSLFFAFAWLYPDMQVLLFFILPIKVKWLGWFSLVMWALEFITAALPGKISLVLGLAGFLVFFGRELVHWCQDTYINYKRRRQWNDQWKR